MAGPAPSPGPSPYYELRGLLFSGNIGSTNYSRFKSTSTDALFNQYAGGEPAQQLQIMHKIQKVMVTQFPFIPVTEGVDWYQYDTTHIDGLADRSPIRTLSRRRISVPDMAGPDAPAAHQVSQAGLRAG